MALHRVTTRFSGGPAVGGGINKLYFDDSLSAASAAGAVVDFWEACAAVQVNTLQMIVDGTVEIVDVESGQVTGLAVTDTVTVTGANNQDPLPKASQGLIRLRTGDFINGRERRGRIFVPGLLEANNEGGSVGTSLRTALATAADILVATDLFVVYRRPPADEPGTGAFSIVQSASVWDQWAVLRSRRD